MAFVDQHENVLIVVNELTGSDIYGQISQRVFERARDAKQALFELLDAELAPLREKYEALMARPDHIESVLRAGAEKARAIATPLMLELRRAVGLRDLREQAGGRKAAKAKAALPVFKQYRERDGRFFFKLTDARGEVLLQSHGFTAPRDAAQAMARLGIEVSAFSSSDRLADARGVNIAMARHDSLEAATRWAFDQANEGDAVLLSPACASLDMFRNYAHRAEVFVQTVHDIAHDRGEVA